MNAHVLVVDDEADIRELLSMTLTRMGAAVSKNPYALVAAERRGVRRT